MQKTLFGFCGHGRAEEAEDQSYKEEKGIVHGKKRLGIKDNTNVSLELS